MSLPKSCLFSASSFCTSFYQNKYIKLHVFPHEYFITCEANCRFWVHRRCMVTGMFFFVIPYFRNFKFVRVSSLVGRYFYNVCIVKKIKLYFPQMSRTIIYVHVYIMLDFPITVIGNASVLCLSECECLHETVNMVVFFLRMMKIPIQKGKHSSKCTELSLKRRREQYCVSVQYPITRGEWDGVLTVSSFNRT